MVYRPCQALHFPLLPYHTFCSFVHHLSSSRIYLQIVVGAVRPHTVTKKGSFIHISHIQLLRLILWMCDCIIVSPLLPRPSPHPSLQKRKWGGRDDRLRGRTIWFSSYCSLSSLVRSKVGGERWRGGNTIARSYRSACGILHFRIINYLACILFFSLNNK